DVRVGDHVDKGQRLATVRNNRLAREVKKFRDAEQRLKLDEKTLERLKALLPTGKVEERRVDSWAEVVRSSKNAVLTAQRDVLATYIKLRETAEEERDVIKSVDPQAILETHGKLEDAACFEILAPVAGTLLQLPQLKGWAGGQLFVIADLTSAQVWANAPEAEVSAIEGIPADQRNWTIALATNPGATSAGKFLSIGKRVNPADHTVLVGGMVDNSNNTLRAGQFVIATIAIPGRLALPAAAVVEKEGAAQVLVEVAAQPPTFRWQKVEVLKRSDDSIVCRPIADPAADKADADKAEGELFHAGTRVVVWGDPQPASPAPETPKPADEQQSSESLSRVQATRLLAALADDHGYGLAPDQAVRRVPPPFADIRMEWYRVGNPDQSKLEPDGPAAMTFHWRNEELTGWGMTFCSCPGYSLADVLDSLLGIKHQTIDAPDELLTKHLAGDWVVRPDAPAEQVLAQLETILREELALPIKLEFRQIERPVYVAVGTYRYQPIPQRAAAGRTNDTIEVFAKHLHENGGGSGNFDEMLNWIGDWIGTPIVSEAAEPHPKTITWLLHARSPFTAQMQAEDHDPEAVLANIAAQTGLTFQRQTRPVKTLVVREAK
ncbi:MAG TPA: efflux RND transporter periplasmic adaptor subunit, partial [Pirellulales bacterium]|nr:efflux RND transporter periplasmic adaptor subunit [Pirellulales bacterium]